MASRHESKVVFKHSQGLHVGFPKTPEDPMFRVPNWFMYSHMNRSKKPIGIHGQLPTELQATEEGLPSDQQIPKEVMDKCMATAEVWGLGDENGRLLRLAVFVAATHYRKIMGSGENKVSSGVYFFSSWLCPLLLVSLF